MKKLVRISLIFVLPLLITWAALETFYRIVPNNYTFKQHQISKNSNAKVLILGNSHAFYGLNPKFFEAETFNLANISQDIFFDELLFDQKSADFPKLEYLIINLEYTSLSQRDNVSEARWRKYFYREQLKLDMPNVPVYDVRCYSLALTQRFRTSVGYVNSYLDKGTLITCDANGWGNDYTFENRRTDIEQTAKYTVAKHEDHSIDFEQNTSRLRHIIAQCAKRKIKVILVTMPVSNAYANAVNPAKLAKIFAVGNELGRRNENCTYVNLFKSPSFSPDDFFDADHLNDRGAKKCSKLIDNYLVID